MPQSVYEQPKRGFAVPLVRWFKNELRYRLDRLVRADQPVYAYVDHASVVRLVNEHTSGRRDHSHMIWRILVLDLWMQALSAGVLSRSSLDLAIA